LEFGLGDIMTYHVSLQRKGGIFEGGSRQIEADYPNQFFMKPGANVPAVPGVKVAGYQSIRPKFVTAMSGLASGGAPMVPWDGFVGAVRVGGPEGNVFTEGAAAPPAGGATARGGVFESAAVPEFVVLEQRRVIGADTRALPPYTPGIRTEVRRPVPIVGGAKGVVPFGCVGPDGMGC
jgi:hypothetical protein